MTLDGTTTQPAKAKLLKDLHVPGDPLVLVNVWDAGSAKAVTDAGASALATSSWSVAAAADYPDGEELPLEHLLGVVQRIAASSDLPLTVDLERGFGADAAQVQVSAAAVIGAGAIGVNLQDSIADGTLREPAEQAERIAAVRAAAESAGVPLFINARTDIFFGSAPHTAELVESALARAAVFADAGADGLFVPGLLDLELIADLASRSPLPVNIMLTDDSVSMTALAAAGAARVSQGPAPYLRAMAALTADAKKYLAPPPSA